ncbi:MAG: hypothetical protein H0U84_00295 [Thermoleophilaceae bacterium]|nr:hypothetical protein [Thermoleophilaceae bacterium]
MSFAAPDPTPPPMRKLAVPIVLLCAMSVIGCRPYGQDSPFNRPVPGSPKLLSNSGAIVDRLDGWGPVQQLRAGHADTSGDYFHPVYVPSAKDPVYTVRCERWTSSCEVEGHRVRIPSKARPAGGADGHLAAVQPDGWEYDFWQVRSKPANGGTLVVSHGGRTRYRGDGLGSDATAAEFGLAAGVISGEEMKLGRIDHALFMHVRCTSGTSVYPATPGTTGSICSDRGNAPPLGAHVWLDMSEAQIAALRVPTWKKTILRALHRYGAYVGDTTGGSVSWGLQGLSGSSYTSFGRTDPWVDVARSAGLERWRGSFYFDMDSGVDWRRHLKVVHPCVANRTC